MTEELKEASNEELLEAVLHHFGCNPVYDRELLRLGFALAQENGWRYVAPAWLATYRNREPLFREGA